MNSWRPIEFCIEHDGRPLFNQTPGLTPAQVRTAFGPEIELFNALRRQRDPDGRFYTPCFERLFGE